jgi:4-diphosphocytidyl-2-C-methyl-D-erythritol kinase
MVFPNGKINLGLRVTRKREDGFHDIETIFYPVQLKDALEAVQLDSRQSSVSNQEEAVSMAIYGLLIKGDAADNLCVKAWQLLKKDFPDLPAVAIHLLKQIPIGAGLGGGSADGAFMLQLLNNQFQLRLTRDQLVTYALQLGSDCPFFIHNIPCHATGRGEQLQPVAVDLSAYKMIIVNPGIHIPTAWAFSQLFSPAPGNIPLTKIVQQPPPVWKELLGNDFEQPVFGHYPEIQTAKETLYRAGAVYASMSGSGSTLFGIFEKGSEPVLDFPDGYNTINL